MTPMMILRLSTRSLLRNLRTTTRPLLRDLKLLLLRVTPRRTILSLSLASLSTKVEISTMSKLKTREMVRLKEEAIEVAVEEAVLVANGENLPEMLAVVAEADNSIRDLALLTSKMPMVSKLLIRVKRKDQDTSVKKVQNFPKSKSFRLFNWG